MVDNRLLVAGVVPGADGFRYCLITSMAPEETIGYLTKVFAADANDLPDMEPGPLMTSRPVYSKDDALRSHVYFSHKCRKGLFGGPKN